MPRLPRVVAAGFPHHITQRGNRKTDIFLDDIDRRTYLKLLAVFSKQHSLKTWAYCLMDNHVHLIVVPERQESLSKTLQLVHGDYAGYFNARHSKSGHLWQGRFKGSILDDRHLWNAVRYVERNPVRAGIIDRAELYYWSSAATHCGMRRDKLVSDDLPLIGEVPNWKAWLDEREQNDELKFIRERTLTGRPCASDEFTRALEIKLGRRLLPQKTGPKK